VAQIFPPSANTLARLSIVGGALVTAGILVGSFVVYRASFLTQVNINKEQPVPFSHRQHVGGLGMDCRFCHTSVEDSSFAGVPPTHTCMSCHSQVLTGAAILQPVRDSWSVKKPLEWTRVSDLPDFVYFDHSIHISKGVGCVTCHGRLDQMPLTWKVHTFHMSWCLDCHRAPENFLRPREQVYSMDWRPAENQRTLGVRLVKEYDVNVRQLTNCSVCHR